MLDFRHGGVALLGMALLLGSPQSGWAQKAKDSLFPPDKAGLELVSPLGRWPDFASGQKRRVHVWYAEASWHFRCTCGSNATTFDGAVTLDKGGIQILGGDGELEQRGADGNVKNPNKADYVRLTPNGMGFRFQSFGKLDGLDFTVPKEAKKIRFEFVVNNESKAEYIFIGATGAHPSEAAFTLKAHPDKP